MPSLSRLLQLDFPSYTDFHLVSGMCYGGPEGFAHIVPIFSAFCSHFWGRGRAEPAAGTQLPLSATSSYCPLCRAHAPRWQLTRDLVCLAQSHTPHQVGSGPGKVSAPVQVRESTQHSQAESHSCSTLQRVQSAPPTSNSLEEAGDLPKSHICQSSCQNQCLLPSLASCPGPDSTKGHSKSVSYLKNGVITGSSFLGCPRIKGFAQGPYAACSQ